MESKDNNLVLLGLDSAGKTSLLYKLKLGETVATIPTIGFNVETIVIENFELKIWDVGGSEKIRPLWKHYIESVKCLIWAVSLTDTIERWNESRMELQKLLEQPTLAKVPILVFATKSDLASDVNSQVSKMIDTLDLDNMKDRTWYVQACSSETGYGLQYGIEWICTDVKTIITNDQPDSAPGPEMQQEESPAEQPKEEVTLDARVLLLGVDHSGKTTLLYHLKLGETVLTIPTIGFNVETVKHEDTQLTIWDVGGQPKLKALWKHYFANTKAVVYLVDFTQPERIMEAQQDLLQLSCNEDLKDTSFHIIVNKFDGNMKEFDQIRLTLVQG